MNKKYLILGALMPLVLNAQETLQLQELHIQDERDFKKEYKEASFYKTYSSEVFTKKDINDESATTLTEVLKNVSNIQVKDRGSFSKSISIRGLSGERVVSIVDGMKMSNHGMTLGGGGELSLINTSSVEKIEVIKGSPSIIYDPGATGGVVKVTTIKNPRKLKDHISANYVFNYDDGYMLKKHTANAELKYKDIFISIGGSLADSEGRRVKDKEKQNAILYDLDEEAGTAYEIKDFGYTSKSTSGLINYQFHDKAGVYYKKHLSHSKDITQAFGSKEPRIFHYANYDKDGDVFGLNLNNIFGFNKIDIMHSNQKLYRATHGDANSIDEVELISNTTKISFEYPVASFLLLSGYEHTQDDADTLTLSHQTYDALYLNAEYIKDAFTITAGLRYNRYHVTQDLKPGQNADAARNLVGVSGVLDGPIDDDAFNYSAGVLYSLNDYNNISANYSRTYRYPSLYERFALGGGFVGGGADLQAEEANNYEISFKHLSKEWSVVATIFQSDFDTYNSFREHNSLKPEYEGNLAAFEDCEDDIDCDPFDSVFIYTTFKDVKNSGFELDVEKRFSSYGITTNFLASLSHLSDALYQDKNMAEPLLVEFAQDPLEFGFNIKKDFKTSYKPWVKLKLRYVTNSPKVDQEDKYGNPNFDAFGVADLYFGAKTKVFSFSGGIRNLTNAVYHEPYSPLDGVERTVFFNLGIKLEKLL